MGLMAAFMSAYEVALLVLGSTAVVVDNTLTARQANNFPVSKNLSLAQVSDDLKGSQESEFISSGDGSDRVFSGKGDDVVFLGRGNDYVRVGGGLEKFYGGDGKDYISYYDSSGGVTVNLATNAISGSWAVNDTISGFECFSGSKFGGDHVTGTSGSNTIKTYGGNDKVYAGKGADRVELGDGNDYVRVGGGQEYFDGGSGTDYISYYDSSGGIRIDLEKDQVSVLGR